MKLLLKKLKVKSSNQKALKPTDEHVRSLQVPAGFTVTKFADDLGKSRMIKVSANGTVYVTDRDCSIVTMLEDSNKDGKADVQK